MPVGAPPQQGQYTFCMNVVCDSYVGCDTRRNVVMVVESAEKAEELAVEEVSEPEEDSLAGQMALMKGEKVKRSPVHDDSSGSDTEGDEALDDVSTTDTETDSDEE